MHKNPIIVAIAGWVLLPSMYLAVGIMTNWGLSVPVSFLLAAPLGIIGFLCWLYALGLSCWSLFARRQTTKSIVGILICLPAILFFALAIWASLNGA